VTRTTHAGRILVVALDGATWDLLYPWLDEEVLPNLRKLAQRGVTGSLQSTLPPVTCPAWPSFMTGKQPANHGVFDFFQQGVQPGDVELVNSTHIRSRLFWEYLSDAGVSVGILNVPLTYPPRPVNGYVIPGLLAPDQGAMTHPPRFWQPYQGELGPYRVTPEVTYKPGNEARFIADLHALTATQIRYAHRLAQEHPTDFLMVHFLATDIAQHKLWRHLDATHPWHRTEQAHFGRAVRDLYTQIDAGLGQLLSLMPGATVLVISDHGFGAQTQTVNLNIYFAERGLLTFKEGRALKRRAWQQPWTTKIGQRLWHRQRLLDWDDVDWKRTRAYSLGHMGQVWLNATGRERAAVSLEVAAALQALCDPQSGTPLVARLIWRNEAPAGSFAHLSPDLYVMMVDPRVVAYPLLAADGRIVTEQKLVDSGNHRPEGILIAAGPGIRPGGQVAGARLIDLAPTILHLLGTAVPDDLDGVVLQSLLAEPGTVCYQRARAGDAVPTTFQAEQQDIVAAQLRALGYLEG
jgi:predicted AlkP superfamily phosphohydrolase/phosphomutase